MGGNRGFVIIGNTHAVTRHRIAADINADCIRWNANAQFANRHDNPAPIGIFASDGGFDQRRIGNGKTDLTGNCIGPGTRNINGDKLGCAFAIAHNLDGKIAHDRGQGSAEISQCRIIDIGNQPVASHAACHQENTIIGRGVAINGNGIEAVVIGGAKTIRQNVCWHGRIGADIAKHGCHIWRNHA